MRSIHELDAKTARQIRYVLFDIDDTITQDGRLLKESYNAIWALHDAGLHPIPVTGRPAGWCDLIIRQWPVSAVIGENGAFAHYMDKGRLMTLYHPNAPEPDSNRDRLMKMGDAALGEFPGLRIAKDQNFRLFDLALDFAEEEPVFDLGFAKRVKEFCEKQGAVSKISSIHVNSWFGDYDKLGMSKHFLLKRFGVEPIHDRGQVLFIGDSPNDEPMFSFFENSCAVSNIGKYLELIMHKPQFVSQRPFGYGFEEIICVLLSLLE